MRNLILITLATFVFAGCQMKQKVMDAGIVSMTHSHVPEGARLKEMGPVKGQFCPKSEDRGQIGLFDQAVTNAQKEHNVDFITDASFWRDQSGCVSLEGTGQKIAGGGASSDMPTPNKKASKKN